MVVVGLALGMTDERPSDGLLVVISLTCKAKTRETLLTAPHSSFDLLRWRNHGARALAKCRGDDERKEERIDLSLAFTLSAAYTGRYTCIHRI